MSVVCHNKILNAEFAKIFFIYLPFDARKGISFSKVHRGLVIITIYGYECFKIYYLSVYLFFVFYLFMLIKNSSLLMLCLMLFSTNCIASKGFISARCFLRIHILCCVKESCRRSSLLVLLATKSIAG
jgi:hypothetical protein